MLQQAVTHIQGELRRISDLVGRIGGDEFVIALARSDPTDLAASQLAAHIVARLCGPFELGDGIVVEMGVSIGLAKLPPPRPPAARADARRRRGDVPGQAARQENAYAAALTES